VIERMVAGGGFEPLSGIDNTYLTESTNEQNERNEGNEGLTVQIQYKRAHGPCRCPCKGRTGGIRPIPPASDADVLAVFNRNPIYSCLFGEDEHGAWTAHNGMSRLRVRFRGSSIIDSSFGDVVARYTQLYGTRSTGHILVILHTGLLPAGLPNLFFLVWNCRLSTTDVGL
jgi:hypothetical protein